MIRNFDELIDQVKNNASVKRVAVVAAHDRHTLEAVLKARADGIAEPVLIGDAGKISAILKDLSAETAGISIIDAKGDGDAARVGVLLVHEGKADFIMKGILQTADLLKAVVDKETGLRTGDGIMSHFVVNEVPAYHKLLVTSDGGMVTYPDLEQKRGILENAVEVLLSLGYECPKVAALAAVETPNPKMPEAMDAFELKKMNQQGIIQNCLVEGPISYDLAVSTESAEAKGYDSPVAGDADILIVPNITAGNILGKALVFSAGAKMAGFITGARVPVVLTSRGATAEEKYLSIVLSAAYAR